MTDTPVLNLTRRKLRTPRAAAIAGILFALLYGTSLVLIRLSIPTDQGGNATAWLDNNTKTVALALNLVPYAGIAFLWFIGVIRDRLGDSGRPFFRNRVPGQRTAVPGINFYRCGIGGRIVEQLRSWIRSNITQYGIYTYSRAVMYQILNIYAIRMEGVFMISLGTIWLRTGLMHRGWTFLTYATALVLLLSIGLSLWVTMVFPVWVFVISVYFLIQNLLASPGNLKQRIDAKHRCHMRTRKLRRVTARYSWDRLKVSFWFVPAVMSLVALLLVWTTNSLDKRIPNEILENSGIVISGNVDGLRAALLSMATSVLATAGVVFTLLTLPLSTVAAQFGSRLLRTFLGDRITQFVLGMFVATFVYCLAAATSIPPAYAQPNAPQVTATVGIILMLFTFGSLILLVQHISIMLQAPNIAAAAGAELMEVILAESPDDVESGDASGQSVPQALMETEGYPIGVRETGYIQFMDSEYVLAVAQEKNLVIRMLRKPGDFVWRGAAVAQVWSADKIDEELDRQIRRSYRMGRQRTPTQDVAYAFSQLVEVAVRAMSPAINDPFTAMTCLEYIGNGLTLFIQQGERSPAIYDDNGKLAYRFRAGYFRRTA